MATNNVTHTKEWLERQAARRAEGAALQNVSGSDVVYDPKVLSHVVDDIAASQPAASGVVKDIKPVAKESKFDMGNAANMAIMFAPMAPGLAASTMGGVSKVAGAVGLTSVAEGGKNAQAAIKNFTDKTVGDVFGGNKVSAAIGDAATKSTAAIGGGLNKVADASGFSEFAPKYSTGRAAAHITNVGKRIGEYHADHAAHLPSSLQAHANEIISHVDKKHASHIDVSKFEAAVKEYAGKAGELKDLSKEQKQAVKAFGKVVKTAEKAVASHSNAISLSRIGTVVSELPQAIGKAKIVPGAMGAFYIAASLVSIGAIASGFLKNMGSLKKMDSDITGKENPSLLANTPKPVAEARNKVVGNTLVSEAAAVGGLVASVVSASHGNVGTAAFMVPAMLGMAGNAAIGDSALPIYDSLEAAHKAGQEIPVEAYAQLIGQASPDLRVRGGEDSAFTKKIAEKLAAEKASPHQIMQEIDNGSFRKRIDNLLEENAAQKPPGADVVVKSHVAKLKEPEAKPVFPKKEHDVIGDHTSRLVSDAANASHILGA